MSLFKFEPNLYPVGDLIFKSSEGREFVYHPLDDITPIEVAHFVHLISFASTSKVGISWVPFVDKHELWRHLKERK